MGTGSIGRRHARVAAEADPTLQVAVLKRSPAPLHADTTGLVFSHEDDALAWAPDAVIVSSPSPWHVTDALRFGRTGAALLIEKPLSTNWEDARALRDEARTWPRQPLLGYNLRHTTLLPQVQRLLQGVLPGRVLRVRAEVGQHLAGWRPGADYRDGVSARQALGGGVLLELSHEIDYLCWLFGRPLWVQAALDYVPTLDTDCEDVAHLLLAFPRSGNQSFVASVTLDHVRQDTTRLLEVVAEHGTLRWDAVAGTLSWYTAAAGWSTVGDCQNDGRSSYTRQWAHFVDVAAGRVAPRVTLDDGLRVLEVVEAVRQSARDGARVYLQEER